MSKGRSKALPVRLLRAAALGGLVGACARSGAGESSTAGRDSSAPAQGVNPTPALPAAPGHVEPGSSTTEGAVPPPPASDDGSTPTSVESSVPGPSAPTTPGAAPGAGGATTVPVSAPETATTVVDAAVAADPVASDRFERDATVPAPRVLVFSATAGYRHASIEDGVEALVKLAEQRGWRLRATEDANVFTATGLEEVNVVVFLSTTGDVLDPDQQLAFERFIRAGNGYVGVHAASDTEYDWPWYGGLVGAYFNAHPEIQRATIIVEDGSHAATRHLPTGWTRTDEWYGFRTNPRAQVDVLLALDESSYSAGQSAMGEDHPIAWAHEYDGGRAFYTALGHTPESYGESEFLQHLVGGIEWAAGL